MGKGRAAYIADRNRILDPVPTYRGLVKQTQNQKIESNRVTEGRRYAREEGREVRFRRRGKRFDSRDGEI
jgi:hypothetical protein